jgi:hypothetical protein
MTLAISIGIVSFLLILFILFTAIINGAGNTKDHVLLRLLLIFIFLGSLILISKSEVDNSNFCEIKLNYTDKVHVYGDNLSGYHWDYDNNPNPATVNEYLLLHIKEYNTYDYICFNNASKTALTFYKLTLFVNSIYWVYILVYTIYFYLVKKKFIKGFKESKK